MLSNPFLLLLAATIATTVTAQALTDLPTCSVNCIATGLAKTNCGLANIACACGKIDTVQPTINPCLKKACPNVSDQQKTIQVVQGVCAKAGVPVNPQPITAAAMRGEFSYRRKEGK